MPRKTRFSFCGEYYHVIVRGNNKNRIFFSPADRLHFMSLLEYGVTHYKYKIHAFCLMSNHVHIALQVENVSISKIMHNITFRYAKWLNSRQKRVGHVFQGRFKSIFVASKSQLLELVRYIHLNPVRAKMVKFAENYKWSSYQSYLRKNYFSWLNIDTVLNILDENRLKALDKYKLIHSALLPKIEDVLEYRDMVPIDDFFTYPPYEESPKVIEFSELVKHVCNNLSISEQTIITSSRKREFSKVRGMIVWLAVELNVATLTYCARFFKRNESVLTRIVDRLQRDNSCQALFNHMKDQLRQ